MTYSDKVKASSRLYNMIVGMPEDGTLKVIYGKKYNGEPREFTIRAYSDYRGDLSYSINNGMLSGMNISKVGKTSLAAYTYDMMGQRTTYTFPLYEMELNTNA